MDAVQRGMIPTTGAAAWWQPGEVREVFFRSSGPGGQNVNKVSTAVQLRFDVTRSLSLPDDAKTRLIRLAGRRMTVDGVLVVRASRFRSQARNREDAYERLAALVRSAMEKPPVRRRRTNPSRLSRERRLEQKQHRGEIKTLRRKIIPD